MKTDDVAEVEKYLSKNLDKLVDEYNEMLDSEQDCLNHIEFMRNSDKCFMEWVTDKYFEQTETERA